MKVIILAGGSGTRLFPLSRKCFPKQFLKIAGKKSLLAQTIDRFLTKVRPADIVIVTNADYKFIVEEILREEKAAEASIILEPIGRNTAPAIALACQYCKEKLNASDEEIAKSMQPFFEDTSFDDLKIVAHKYKEIDAWSSDPLLRFRPV